MREIIDAIVVFAARALACETVTAVAEKEKDLKKAQSFLFSWSSSEKDKKPSQQLLG
jgi:hypothetical protein